jgi:hypothetical protein
MKSKVKSKGTRESKYYGIPIRIKPQIVEKINKLDTSKKALNVKLASLLKELQEFRCTTD